MTSETKPSLLRPRWSKVFSDLWDDKTRSILVVASIAVGVFAVGMIITTFVILREDINSNYAAANPVNVEVWTAPFYEDLIRVIEKVPGVEEITSTSSEGSSTVRVSFVWGTEIDTAAIDVQGKLEDEINEEQTSQEFTPTDNDAQWAASAMSPYGSTASPYGSASRTR